MKNAFNLSFEMWSGKAVALSLILKAPMLQ